MQTYRLKSSSKTDSIPDLRDQSIQLRIAEVAAVVAISVESQVTSPEIAAPDPGGKDEKEKRIRNKTGRVRPIL